jgi:hypothetical protein
MSFSGVRSSIKLDTHGAQQRLCVVFAWIGMPRTSYRPAGMNKRKSAVVSESMQNTETTAG